MKIILILLLILQASLAFSQTLQEDRRIEENKRESLKNSEIDQPLVTRDDVPQTPQNKSDFLKQVSHKEYTTLDDIAYIMTVLLKKDAIYLNYEDRMAFLDQQGFVPKNISQKMNDPEALITKGEYSFMLKEALDIAGGLTLRVSGPTERYAYKEMQYQGFLGGGYHTEPLPGSWAIYAFIQAIDYLDEQAAD